MMPDVSEVQTPVYICDRGCLEDNLKILAGVATEAECKVLMALKGFAMFSLFPEIQQYLHGLSASSLDEALLAYEEFEGGEIHVYAPAYSDRDFPKLLDIADHLVFNSFSQWRRFRDQVQRRGAKVSCGIRVNPEHREVKVALYDPSAPYSRLGVTRANFEPDQLEGLDGLHFHTLCELNSDALLRTVAAVEEKFGAWLPRMKWVNFGGGHHITRPDYDRQLLCEIVRKFKEKYGVEVYLEPGEAIALNIGVLVASVLDIINNGMDIAILDTSAAAHMPDVLEMPYRPEIVGAGKPGELPHTYRLGGLTCLAGDVIGDYSFAKSLTIGQKLVFCDMAHYTMVKNNAFNGVRLPSIAIFDPATGTTEVVRRFSHEDYKNRLS